jgi:uncharacterized protein involved in exopolysaccharide biosynthesis
VREPQYLTLLQLCNDVLRRCWTVAATVVLCALAAACVALVRPRTYTSSASFVAEARQPLSDEVASGASLDMMGASEQRGGAGGMTRPLTAGGSTMRLPSLAPARPLDPGFYYTTMRSPEFLLELAASRFSVATPAGVRSGAAADFYGLPDGPARLRAEDAARRFARDLTIDYEILSGLLTLNVRTPHAGFSQAVATRMLDLVMERNRRMADGRVQSHVAFLERAASEARRDLAVAQNRLARFLEANRAFVPASRLALEYRRLDRDVLATRQQYLDLALQLERAKLDRARATQLVTVVVRPETPLRPDSRGTARTTIAGAVAGGALALLVVLTRAHLARLRAAGSDDLSALEAEWRLARRHPLASGNRVSASGAMAVNAGRDGP